MTPNPRSETEGAARPAASIPRAGPPDAYARDSDASGEAHTPAASSIFGASGADASGASAAGASQGSPGGGRRGSRAAGRWALVVALGAAVVAGWAAWQSSQLKSTFEARQAKVVADLSTTIDTLKQRDVATADQLAALEESAKAQGSQIAAIASRVDNVPERLDALEQRVEADTGSSNARREWLRSAAEYYLSVANTELQLGRRWNNAITALALADDRLRQLSDPRLVPVRQAIADELIELKSVQLPDLEGIALRLAGLAAHVEDLPFAAPGGDESAATAQVDAQSGLDRFWSSVRKAFSGLISFRRSTASASAILSMDEKLLARRQLELELQLARAAALNGDAKAFAASVGNAKALLSRDFDEHSAAVRSASDQLAQLQGVDIAPALPDISASLNRLRQVNEAR